MPRYYHTSLQARGALRVWIDFLPDGLGFRTWVAIVSFVCVLLQTVSTVASGDHFVEMWYRDGPATAPAYTCANARYATGVQKHTYNIMSKMSECSSSFARPHLQPFTPPQLVTATFQGIHLISHRDMDLTHAVPTSAQKSPPVLALAC
eukprot:782647-Amphidinium_carterae.2